MTLVDTGPFVALFDPQDHLHGRCRSVLERLRGRLVTTVPVLTEVFHLLTPSSRGAELVREYVGEGNCALFYLDDGTLERAFELMEKYRDRPMDLADASIIVAAEALATRRVFTLDRNDFETYRIRKGHRSERVRIID